MFAVSAMLFDVVAEREVNLDTIEDNSAYLLLESLSKDHAAQTMIGHEDYACVNEFLHAPALNPAF